MHLKVTTERIICKNCGSLRVVKHGSYKGKQCWLCRDCGKTSTDNDAVYGGKLPSKCVSYALGAYYDGLSLNAIRRNLKQQYDVCPSSATVFEWVDKYTKRAINETKNLKPKVSGIWIADESYVRIDQRKDKAEKVENPYDKSKQGKWVIFWDIIDSRTRFLLASLVTTTRGIDNAKKLMELAAERSGRTPRVVVTDRLRAYIEGVEQAYGADTVHRQGGPFDIECNTNIIERFQGSLKSRTKVMRGLRSLESTKFFTDGWLAYYNFLRPHMSLGKTPAQAAGIKCPFSNWSELIGVRESPLVSVDITKERVGSGARTSHTGKSRSGHQKKGSRDRESGKSISSVR